MKSFHLSQYFDRLLNTGLIPDDSQNGLQIENRSEVKCVAFAVDVSLESIRLAKEKGAQFLFVHHGLFWGKPAPVVGVLYQRIRACVETDIALYASHLPLDLHPTLGNNAQLVKLLVLKNPKDFGEYHGNLIGKAVFLKNPMTLSGLAQRMRSKLSIDPIVWNFGEPIVRRLAIISGGALSMIEQVAREGMDTFITGETNHIQYWLAKEYKLNVLFGGHYRTETVGLQALQKKTHSDLKLQTCFIDLPTGY